MVNSVELVGCSLRDEHCLSRKYVTPLNVLKYSISYIDRRHSYRVGRLEGMERKVSRLGRTVVELKQVRTRYVKYRPARRPGDAIKNI